MIREFIWMQQVALWSITHLWKLHLPSFGKHFLIEIDNLFRCCMPSTIIINTEHLFFCYFAFMTCSLISTRDGNQDESVPFALQIEQEWNVSGNLTMMISLEIESQPWPKGYACTDPSFLLLIGIQNIIIFVKPTLYYHVN